MMYKCKINEWYLRTEENQILLKQEFSLFKGSLEIEYILLIYSITGVEDLLLRIKETIEKNCTIIVQNKVFITKTL